MYIIVFYCCKIDNGLNHIKILLHIYLVQAWITHCCDEGRLPAAAETFVLSQASETSLGST